MFWAIVISLAVGWLGASFVANLTGYNVADYFFKAKNYVEKEAKKL